MIAKLSVFLTLANAVLDVSLDPSNLAAEPEVVFMEDPVNESDEDLEDPEIVMVDEEDPETDSGDETEVSDDMGMNGDETTSGTQAADPVFEIANDNETQVRVKDSANPEAAAACLPMTGDGKYVCRFPISTLQRGVINIYVGRDAENVYIKASSQGNSRWLGVGPSKAGMGNLLAIINRGDPTADDGVSLAARKFTNSATAGITTERKDDINLDSYKPPFEETPVVSYDNEQGRQIELVLREATWKAEYEYGLSLAWGTGPSHGGDMELAGHGLTNRKFIRFNNIDGSYQLPRRGTVINTTTAPPKVIAPTVEVNTTAPINDTTSPITPAVVNGTRNATDDEALAKATDHASAAYSFALSALVLLPALVGVF